MLEALTEGEVIRVNVTNILIVEEGQEDRRAASDVMLVFSVRVDLYWQSQMLLMRATFNFLRLILDNISLPAAACNNALQPRMQQITNILIQFD